MNPKSTIEIHGDGPNGRGAFVETRDWRCPWDFGPDGQACGAKLASLESEAITVSMRKPEYQYPDCHLIPPQPWQVDTKVVGWGREAVCTEGHHTPCRWDKLTPAVEEARQ